MYEKTRHIEVLWILNQNGMIIRYQKNGKGKYEKMGLGKKKGTWTLNSDDQPLTGWSFS